MSKEQLQRTKMACTLNLSVNQKVIKGTIDLCEYKFDDKTTFWFGSVLAGVKPDALLEVVGSAQIKVTLSDGRFGSARVLGDLAATPDHCEFKLFGFSNL